MSPTPQDGRITSQPLFTGTLTGSELFPMVSPGNATSGINYGVRASTIAAYITGSLVQGLTLLNVINITSSIASVNDTTSFGSTYNDYMLVFDNIVPSTTGAIFNMQFYMGGLLQTGNYLNQNAATTGCVDLLGTVPGISTTLTDGYSAELFLHNVNNTSRFSYIEGQNGVFLIPNGGLTFVRVGGAWRGATSSINVVTGISMQMNSGNISSGTVKVYGLRSAL
jgi:hypothetical protein